MPVPRLGKRVHTSSCEPKIKASSIVPITLASVSWYIEEALLTLVDRDRSWLASLEQKTEDNPSVCLLQPIISNNSNPLKVLYNIINYSLINLLTTYNANIRKSEVSCFDSLSCKCASPKHIHNMKLFPTVKVRIFSMPWPCYTLFLSYKERSGEERERDSYYSLVIALPT